MNDGTVDSDSTYTMTIDVTAVNDPPTAANNTVTMDEDTTYTFSESDFGFMDADGDALASVKIRGVETAGSLELDGVDVTGFQVISKADIDDGKLTFTPEVNTANNAGYTSFSFQVSDGADESMSAYLMTIVVNHVNDAPTAADNTVTTAEDTAYTFSVADFGFSDVDSVDSVRGLASVKITTLETVGDLELDGVDVTEDQVIDEADIDAGKLTFTPAAGENGTGYATFQFKVNDGTVDSDSAYTMTVDVTASAGVAATGQPAISGAPQVGETLTAEFGTISDDNGLTTKTFRTTTRSSGSGWPRTIPSRASFSRRRAPTRPWRPTSAAPSRWRWSSTTTAAIPRVRSHRRPIRCMAIPRRPSRRRRPPAPAMPTGAPR